MKKIKFFFIRHYQRIIRFLISFSAIGCILAASFSASATAVYNFPMSRPEVNSLSCYVEILMNTGNVFGFYVSATINSGTAGAWTTPYFNCYLEGENFWINAPTLGSDKGFVTGITLNPSGSFGLAANNSNMSGFWLGSGGSISGIHCYNATYSGFTPTNNDFTFVYGNEVNTNDKLDKIFSAIQANKSSAEKSEYSGATSDQKTAQADLDKAEASINADIAEARSSTINLFKNFTLPGDIMKGMLSVTSLFNALCARLPFAPIILNFSLAVGAAAFLLGLTAVFVRFGRSRK